MRQKIIPYLIVVSILVLLFNLSSNSSYANSANPIVNAPSQVNLSYVSSYDITISNVHTTRVRFPTWTSSNLI